MQKIYIFLNNLAHIWFMSSSLAVKKWQPFTISWHLLAKILTILMFLQKVNAFGFVHFCVLIMFTVADD